MGKDIISTIKELKTIMNMNVFCFGIGFDFSFERELAEKYGIHVFAFDPSPEVVEEMTHWDVQGLEYYPYGLSDKDVKRCFINRVLNRIIQNTLHHGPVPKKLRCRFIAFQH